MSKYIIDSDHGTKYMEGLSVAYVKAVASSACCSMSVVEPDTTKIDVTIHRPGYLHGVGFQLKATSDWTKNGNQIIYDLDAATYNLLTRATHEYPAFLGLMLLPDLGQKWLDVDHDSMVLKHAVYWHFLGGTPATHNTSAKRINLDASHLLTADWLNSLFDALENGTGLSDVYL